MLTSAPSDPFGCGQRTAEVPWHAHDDAIAAEPALVAVVSQGVCLASLVATLPVYEELLLRTARARLLRTFAASKLGAQAASAQAQRRLVSISSRCRLTFAKPGRVVARQGDEITSLYIVVQGAVYSYNRPRAPRTSSDAGSEPD